MPNFASAVLMGHLTRDVEVRAVGESSVASFGVAVSRRVKGQDEVSFFDVKAWGKTGEFCSKYFAKFDAILVQTEIYTETWEDRNGGGRRSKMVCQADRVTFAGGAKQGREKLAKAAEPITQGPAADADGNIPF